MGALDYYAAIARCPRCDDLHAVDGQTKFFVPEFGRLHGRYFQIGRREPLDLSPAELAAAREWDGRWWRVRESQGGPQLDLLVDWDELFGCDCGAHFAPVLRFHLDDAPSATLIDLQLREADSPGATDVDFAEVEPGLWTGNQARYAANVHAIAHEPEPQRRARLHRALAARHAPDDLPDPVPTPWTRVLGPTRCEACGETRERSEFTLLTHPDHPHGFFGEAWTGGLLRPGDRVACDLDWLADDVDRGYYTRLRHPVPEDSLTIAGTRRTRGCRCGAGFGAIVLHFTRDPGGLTLARLSLRVFHSPADLDDIDLTPAPRFIGDASGPRPELRAQTREAVLRALVSPR